MVNLLSKLYTKIHAHIPVLTWTYIHAWINKQAHTYKYIHMHTYTHTYTHTHTHIHTHTHTYTNTHTHTCIHTYTHTQTVFITHDSDNIYTYVYLHETITGYYKCCYNHYNDYIIGCTLDRFVLNFFSQFYKPSHLWQLYMLWWISV